MPNRIIKETINTSEKIASLTDFEFRLWVGLVTTVDDYGRTDARPSIIKARVFPLRERVTTKEIESALHGLAAKGCVSLYEVDGKPYLLFPTWGEHQRIRRKISKFPAPVGTLPDITDCISESATCGNSPQLAAECCQNPESRIQNPESGIQKEEAISTPAAAAQSRVIDYEGVQRLYNTICHNLPKCTVLSDARRKAISARFRNGYTMGDFEKLFRMTAESDFLNGKNTRNWCATFDWLIKDANMAKVLSGNYRNSGGSNGQNGRHSETVEYGTVL